MKPTLKAGLKHRFAYTVPHSKTVPALYREAPQLQVMPEVFATGFMVGLMEWTCVQLLEPHLEKGEGSLGTHERFIVSWDRFNRGVAAKAGAAP